MTIREIVREHSKQALLLTTQQQNHITRHAFEAAASAGFPGGPGGPHLSFVFKHYSEHFLRVVEEVHHFTLEAVKVSSPDDDLTQLLRDIEVDTQIFRDRIAHAVISVNKTSSDADSIQREFAKLLSQKHSKFGAQLALQIHSAQNRKNMSTNVNFHGNAAGVQIGNNNQQTNTIDLRKLIQDIDSSGATDATKQEAKSLIGKLLAHPLVNTLAGSAVGSLLSTLGTK